MSEERRARLLRLGPRIKQAQSEWVARECPSNLGTPECKKLRAMMDIFLMECGELLTQGGNVEERDEQDGLRAIAHALHRLGNADASTPMGGLEALGKVIKESNERIAEAIGDLASAVHRLADNAEQDGSA